MKLNVVDVEKEVHFGVFMRQREKVLESRVLGEGFDKIREDRDGFMSSKVLLGSEALLHCGDHGGEHKQTEGFFV